ncbi:MAG: AMP-binding protein [Alphaproteobacteria bacterium]|jgi:long-chain acyl-CoA synthetase|nr:AMP-binding protein [Alphaproteobacteria bacterium]
MNLAAWMERAARSGGDRPALALGTSVVRAYGLLHDRVARLARAMREELGLAPGERVGLVMKNCPEYFEVLFAAWHGGFAAVPINAKLHASEFQYILEHSGASACFVTPDLAETIHSIDVGTLRRIVVVGEAEYEALLRAEPMDLADAAPDDLAWLFYTSGTTGRPKGAMLSHRNLATMSYCYFSDVDPAAPWTSILHAAPMSHGSGCYGLAHVMQGSCQVLPESGGFYPEEIYQLIEAWPHLSFFAAPTMVKRLIDHPADTDTSNLKVIFYGGGPMYVADTIAALDRFGDKLSQLYGQGESPMTITYLDQAMHAERDHPRWMERLGSVGVQQSAVEVRTVDADDNFLPPGEAGEIVVRGDAVMLGYWRNPEATGETLRGGWLHTGDVGVFDEDGFLTLKDRSKDMIISGGTNIYPREIEEVLQRHAGVAEVSVIGRPDPEWGEVVVAYVVGREGREPPPAELDALCLEHIARFKRPKDYRFVTALPKNNYGKVLKVELREIDAKQGGSE